VQVHVEGVVGSVAGLCPSLQFVVSGTLVVTDATTDFAKKASCSDVKNGVVVTVDGVRNGAIVSAQTVQIQQNQNSDE
jgi:hypothetical protein